jgi:starch synthase
VHSNGWASGFVPLLLRSGVVPALAGVKQIFSIADPADNQLFEPAILDELRLGYELFNPEGIEFHGRVNLLKAGVLYADRTIVFSESTLRELQTEELGGGLHGLFRAQAGKLRGILPGLDRTRWDPLTDYRLAERYDGDTLAGKEACKRALQAELDLPVRPVPLFVMPGPLSPAAGADLLLRSLPALLPLKLQLALLGPPAAELTGPLGDAAAGHRQTLALRTTLDGDLLRRALAGADGVLRPGHDPAGLLILKALSYGALPLCRCLGAARDLVVDLDLPSGSGNGFCFAPQPESLQQAVRRALAAHGQPAVWKQAVRTAMRDRHSLELSALRTLAVYREILDQS